MFITFFRYEHATGARYKHGGTITLNSKHISSLKMFTAYVADEQMTILQIIMTNGIRHYVEPQDYDKFHEVFNSND